MWHLTLWSSTGQPPWDTDKHTFTGSEEVTWRNDTSSVWLCSLFPFWYKSGEKYFLMIEHFIAKNKCIHFVLYRFSCSCLMHWCDFYHVPHRHMCLEDLHTDVHTQSFWAHLLATKLIQYKQLRSENDRLDFSMGLLSGEDVFNWEKGCCMKSSSVLRFKSGLGMWFEMLKCSQHSKELWEVQSGWCFGWLSVRHSVVLECSLDGACLMD